MQSVTLVKLSAVSPSRSPPLCSADTSVSVPICQPDSQREVAQGGRSGLSDTAAEKGQPSPLPAHINTAFLMLWFCTCVMLWKTSSTH